MTEPEEIVPEEHITSDDRDIEAPAADTVEQATPADPAADEDEVRRGLEVGEWDAIEQARLVDLDDDYR